jgi:cation diffusion facilitator family transporter
MAGHEAGRAAVLAALLANTGIAIAKFIGFAFTGAASMLAEAIHSVADAGNQGLLMLGRAQAKRQPDPLRQFGYGRTRFFWAFVVALVLFTLGGVFAIYEGIEKLRHPHEVESLGWAIGILGFAIVLEIFSFRTAIKESRPLKGDGSWWEFIRHSTTPELPVVLLEDLGALLGLVFALAGVTCARVFDEPRFDAAGSLAIGVLLVVIAATLAWEMSSLLLGESANPKTMQRLRDALESGDSVVRVIHMRTEHIGPEELLVAAKLEFAPGLSVAELAGEIDAAETRAREAVPNRCQIYLEPGLYDPTRAAPTTG